MNRFIEHLYDDVIEESLVVGLFLALGIGNLNACTYLMRGRVFASSQGGNILYLGMDLARKDLSKFPKYIFPVLMFGTGVFIAERFHVKYARSGWQKKSTVLEIFLVLFATFLPDSWNVVANPIFGLVCGLQSITFRRFHDIPLATIYINGNIVRAIEYATRWLHLKNVEDLLRMFIYITIISAYLDYYYLCLSWRNHLWNLVHPVPWKICIALYSRHPADYPASAHI